MSENSEGEGGDGEKEKMEAAAVEDESNDKLINITSAETLDNQNHSKVEQINNLKEILNSDKDSNGLNLKNNIEKDINIKLKNKLEEEAIKNNVDIEMKDEEPSTSTNINNNTKIKRGGSFKGRNYRNKEHPNNNGDNGSKDSSDDDDENEKINKETSKGPERDKHRKIVKSEEEIRRELLNTNEVHSGNSENENESIPDLELEEEDDNNVENGSLPDLELDAEALNNRENESDLNEDHHMSSSSDSSFIEHINLEEEESDSDSDCYLEDLDEHESNVPEKAEEEDNEPSSPSASQKKKEAKKKEQEIPKVLQKPKPKHNFDFISQLYQREMGYTARKQPQISEIFRSRFYGSLYSGQRLELMNKLDGHRGCVNCLNFNYSGTKLMSGGDDLKIIIWNYGLGKQITSFSSGHRSNVFQAKFLPLIGIDNMIATCARDSQVRLSELNSTGKVASARKIAQHRGPVHKLAVNVENPHVILSCGEDSFVHSIDIREEKPQRILSLKEKGKRVALYSIQTNPLSPNEFCVSGRDEFVRLYDIRKLRSSTVSLNADQEDRTNADQIDNPPPMKKYCPHHLIENRNKPNVTSAVYNYNGKEIVASYNDENIYLFDTSHSDGADCTKIYEGHRNNATVKGVNFFGDKSQFIISGSDCSHIFLWDKETESIVNFLRGDENGVVNCLEPHPGFCCLATSGLDSDVKIWIPSNEKTPQFGDLTSTVRKNLKKRNEDMNRVPDDLDGQIMLAIWSHIRRSDRERRANREERGEGGTDTDSDSWADDEEDGEEGAASRTSNLDCNIS